MTTTITPGDRPNLSDYDVILISSSAGKDSRAALDVTVEAARAAGVLDRVVVHADLGEEEWPATLELAAELLCTKQTDAPLPEANLGRI